MNLGQFIHPNSNACYPAKKPLVSIDTQQAPLGSSGSPQRGGSIDGRTAELAGQWAGDV